jgi:membrane-associated phospholipid phosphatase
MAGLLIPGSAPNGPPSACADFPSGDRRFWAVDKIILAFTLFTSALVAGWWNRIPTAPAIIAIHAVAMALLIFEVKRPNRTTRLFRFWYPLPYVGACFKEMALLIPAVRFWTADQALADVDYRFWRANPTVWLERIQGPVLTEVLQIAYTLFIPAVLLVAYLLWRKREFGKFQYYGFLIALGFLASYIGYLLVPARGPRFLLIHLQHMPLRGLWLFQDMQMTLDQLESAHFDCFPSGHTELTLLALWGSRLVSKRLFRAYLLYTPALIFATVYLRYHYSVDVLAGGVLAGGLIYLAPRLYRILS